MATEASSFRRGERGADAYVGVCTPGQPSESAATEAGASAENWTGSATVESVPSHGFARCASADTDLRFEESPGARCLSTSAAERVRASAVRVVKGPMMGEESPRASLAPA